MAVGSALQNAYIGQDRHRKRKGAIGRRARQSLREVAPGDMLRIRQGWDEREVIVKGTSEQRRSAPIAQTLYEETSDSVARRERAAEARKAAGAMARPTQRPGKHERKRSSD